MPEHYKIAADWIDVGEQILRKGDIVTEKELGVFLNTFLGIQLVRPVDFDLADLSRSDKLLNREAMLTELRDRQRRLNEEIRLAAALGAVDPVTAYGFIARLKDIRLRFVSVIGAISPPE